MKAKQVWCSTFITVSALLFALNGQTALAAVQFQIDPTGNSWDIGEGWGTDADENGGTLLGATFNLNPSLGSISFSLDPLASYTFNFGSIEFTEPNGNGAITANEVDDLDVRASLTFASPSLQTLTFTADDVTPILGSVSDSATDFTISFQPIDVRINGVESFTVQLSDVSFATRWETKQVNAIVTLNPKPNNGPISAASIVPEPATMLIWSLLGSLAFCASWRRRKNA